MKYFFESKNEVELMEKNSLDFPAHLHEHIEMGYLEKGSAVLILDEKEYTLKEGDFFVVFPNQIHSYKKSENIKTKIIIFSYNLIPEYKNIFSSKIPQIPVIRKADNEKMLMELMFAIMSDNINVLKGFLLSIFGLLTDKIELNDITEYNVSVLKNILIYCSEHFNEGISVMDVANELHISRFHISHIFREKLNTTFSDYLTQKRIEYATSLFCHENLTITDIAYKSGFNSIRSFNRNFLKYMKITPKEYKNRYRKL